MVRLQLLFEPSDDAAAAERHYREVHLPLARKLPHLHAYTVSEDVRGITGKKRYERVESLDFSDRSMLDDALGSSDGKAMLKEVAEFAGKRATVLSFEMKDGR